MSKSMMSRLQEMSAGINKRPAHISDPVAQQTGWDPVFDSPGAMKVQRFTLVPGTGLTAKPYANLSGILFLLIGMAFFMPRQIWQQVKNGDFNFDSATSQDMLPVVIIGIAMIAFHLSKMRAKLVFDQNTNTYHAKGTSTPFSDLYALQIVRASIDGMQRRKPCQLNLVLNTADRLPLSLYNNAQDARTEAAKIQDLVGLSLWDISEPEQQQERSTS